MPRIDPRVLLVSASVAALVVLASWVARMMVEQSLAIGESVSLVGDALRLSRGENSGVAFGLLRGSPVVPWLTAAGVVLLAVFAVQQRSRVASAASGLVLGGGLANVIDRINDARVTDYINVTLGSWRYPTFNLPDVAITLGVAFLLVALLRVDHSPEGDATSDNRTGPPNTPPQEST